MGMFERDAAPDDAIEHEVVPPVVRVDDIADQLMAEERDPPDHEIGLPGTVAQQVTEAEPEGRADETDIGEEAEPAVTGQRFEPDIVLVLGIDGAEHHRTDAERLAHGGEEA